MYHLSRNGARFQMFAPNQQQMHVIDHMRKQPASGENRWASKMGAVGVLTLSMVTWVHFVMNSVHPRRNMMMEAARFGHGQGMTQMQDLSKLDVNSFDAVIFPGGHGIIKNL